MIVAMPTAALGLFGNRTSDEIPGHTVHNQAPDAPPAALSWEELMALNVRVETPAPLQTVFHVSYADSVKAKDGAVVRIKGFMYPLQAGETHTYFLLKHAQADVERPARSCPATRRLPERGVASPASRCSRVLLPEPDGSATRQRSPASTRHSAMSRTSRPP